MLKYALSIAIFIAWWIILALGLKAITLDVDELPVDYRTYASAVELLRTTESPYVGPDTVQENWRSMHQSALAAFGPQEGASNNAEAVSGPYLYPPSLALALDQSGLSAFQYLAMLTVATIALCVGWLRFSPDQSLFWLIAMAGSIDLIAIFLGGNIEILLIALSLFACRLIWRHHALWAAPLIAAVILVKPQYALLFLAFGCLSAFTGSPVRPVLRKIGVSAAIVLLLIVLEAQRWPEPAWADFFIYVAEPSAMQYFALSPEAQWPMSIWNRAPLQVFLNLGLTFEMAQALSIGVCLLLLAASVILLRGRNLSFSAAFSLAYILLLFGRPITWSMPMLAIFTLTAVWPLLPRSGRLALAAVALIVGATHWVAFALFAAGVSPGLLTLQRPGFPWETLVILPGAWVVVVLGARRKLMAEKDRARASP
jgi:hypothetical protein